MHHRSSQPDHPQKWPVVRWIRGNEMNPNIEKRVRAHGLQLLAIFPDATEQDPVKLCQKLRRLEAQGNRHAEQLCNDEHYCNEVDHKAIGDKIIEKVRSLLNSPRPWLNQDPRGYALKIDLKAPERLHHDWGGYGIIAPDLTEAT
jgi:hypothetical protein